MSERVTPHSLRRTYGSLRFAKGDDSVQVAEQLGDLDGTFPQAVYAKAVKRRQRLSGKCLTEFDRALERPGTPIWPIRWTHWWTVPRHWKR